MGRRAAFMQRAAAGVAGLQPYQPGKPVDELERELGIANAVKLASNENPRGPSSRVLSAIADAQREINRYPDGAGFHLKQALAERFDLPPECVTLGNGSNDVLVLLAEAFLTPGTSAVYSRHAFVVYALAVQATGAQARVAPANPPEHARPLGHDLAAMGALIDTSTRIVFIANPNNPTGSWLGSDALREFVESAPPEVLVVVDEAYLEYAAGEDYPDCSEWLSEFPNLVVTRTFSKAYGLAGLRIGYAISHPDVAELLNRVRQPFNVNSVAQAAALAALEDADYVRESVRANATQLHRLAAGLKEAGLGVLPSRANFVLADTGTDAERWYARLLREGVIVRPVANYGLPNHLRISTGLPGEVDELLSTVQRVRGQIA